MSEFTSVEQQVGRDFARARRGAFFGRLAARFRRGAREKGASDGLACFGEEKRSVGATVRVRRGLETVPAEKVSGSVGRCLDFDRGFLPACSCLAGRWRSVDRAFFEGRWLPPVELYKLGGEYFVLDGNHRVSVARYRGVVAVDAVVTEFVAPQPARSSVPPAVRPRSWVAGASF